MAEDYKIIRRDSEQSVTLAFNGVFQGREVVWEARIKTLYAWYLDQMAIAAGDGQTRSLRQFIDIRYCNGIYQVDIGLNLRQIDEPSIKRAIIMMRKYKRLHTGRHEYGEAIQFKVETR